MCVCVCVRACVMRAYEVYLRACVCVGGHKMNLFVMNEII